MPEEGVSSPGAGVIGNCVLTTVDAGNLILILSKGHYVLLTLSHLSSPIVTFTHLHLKSIPPLLSLCASHI